MKKTLLTALVVCASVCGAFAQDQKAKTSTDATVVKEAEQKSPEVKAQEWQKLLETELKLTEEQKTKIAELNKAFDERQQGMENNASYTEEFKAERRVVLKKAREAQIMKLLTAEQQAKYKELLEAKK
jgi:Spy/CpxP family protein refolding chaperone